ncbi:hypothetical protein ACFYO2_05130 [Streptomyces sp. NPDC006602]|uniref:hypothetical protein n=1 Tax=Streptomyces sp. NPDC006602 TaxID=3364751 RepID=UPI0036AD3E5C
MTTEGGAIGATVAAMRPDAVVSLTLVCASAHFGEAAPWQHRAALVREMGTSAVLDSSPARWFADRATTARTPLGSALLQDLAGADAHGYAACCDALAQYDLRESLALISAPTLVIGGTEDTATPSHHAEELAAGVPEQDSH